MARKKLFENVLPVVLCVTSEQLLYFWGIPSGRREQAGAHADPSRSGGGWKEAQRRQG